MSVGLNTEQIEQLKSFITPTVANAIEMFKVRPRTEGFMRPGLHCRFPELDPIVGYAVTATCRGHEPATNPIEMAAYYQSVLEQAPPRIMVAQDLDEQPIGALFGEVSSTLHIALDCVGHITNGGVRDLDEVRELGFQFISGCVQVAHAYIHIEDFGKPVSVGEVTVHPGDLIHADQHGFCLIPPEVAPHLAEACRQFEALEQPLLELPYSSKFTIEEYTASVAEMQQEFAALSEQFARRLESS